MCVWRRAGCARARYLGAYACNVAGPGREPDDSDRAYQRTNPGSFSGEYGRDVAALAQAAAHSRSLVRFTDSHDAMPRER